MVWYCWRYISFLSLSLFLSLSGNLVKNSNFVRTRDTFIPIANDKCVVMLRAWQITPVFSVSFNFKDRSYFFPPPDESLDRVTRTKINKSCSLLEVSFVFSKRKKSFALIRDWRTRFDYRELSCYTTRKRRQFRSNHMKQIELWTFRVWEKRLIEYIGRVISRD